MSDSLWYPLHLCLIFIFTLYTFVGFTSVPFTHFSDSLRYPLHMSDLLQYPLHLCPIHFGTLYTFVWFTSVPFTPLSDSHRYPLHLCLIIDEGYINLDFSAILFHTQILMVLLWIGSCYSTNGRSLIISYTAYLIISI